MPEVVSESPPSHGPRHAWRHASARTSVFAPGPVAVAPGTLTPGLARPAAPLRREGPAQLTGTALYPDDLVFPGAWSGATIRSTEARARLIGVDRDPAFAWDRVVIVTSADLPGPNVVSLIADDQPILVPIGGEIRHHAEPVALIAAPDPATLREAKVRLSLRTEALPPVLDPLKSEQVFAHYEIGRGDVDAALAGADLVVDGEYRVGHQEQLYIENNAMIAVPRPDGGVTVHGSLQCPYYVHKALKRALLLDDRQAQVVQAETGGGFGGKEEYPSMIALHAALLARACGKPVRMIYDRHEDIAATTKRHPAIVRYRSGVSRSGQLLAQDIEIVMDGGAYCTLSPVVLSRGTIHAGGPYRCPAVRIRSRVVATNTPPNGAFRGFGAPQTQFAAEMQVNRVAERTGKARAERAGSGLVPGSALGGGRARTAHGIGLALAWHGAGFTGSGEVHLASVASVELAADGRITVLTASTEMGQGTKTIFPQLAAAELGVPVEAVDIAPQDTELVPDSGPTVASRTAMVVGGLVIKASRRLRADVEARTGGSFAETYVADASEHGPTRIDQQFEPYPGVEFDDATYTGEVVVGSVVAADDLGRAIHPVLAEGQVEGGTLQAVGYATIEEIKLQEGRYLNDRLATYLIPTAMDAPRITSILVEAPFSGAPHGAKGIGELPMDVGAPAVVAAIHDAVGVWIHELPATPERILAAMELERERRGAA